MPCEIPAVQISQFFDEELPPAESSLLAQHIAACRTCSSQLARLGALRDRLREELNFDMPPGLEDRVTGALAQAERSDAMADQQPRAVSRWQSLSRTLMRQAASFILVAGLSAGTTIYVMRQAETENLIVRDVLAAHVRSLLQDSPVQVVSTDQHTVRPWFAGRADFAPPVKDLADKGFPLLGGRLDYVNEHRAAVVVYKHDKHVVDVFVWPSTQDHAIPQFTAHTGYNIASWTSDGMTSWAVSDMNAQELRVFANLLAGP